MSAFIVSEGCIDDVVDLLLDSAGPALAHLCDKDAVGAGLYALNKDSFDRKYPQFADETVPDYAYKAGSGDAAQEYQSLCCFLYQSCEGGCHELPLYKHLLAIRLKLAPLYEAGNSQYAPPNLSHTKWDRLREAA